jgi:hypothetical protein
MAATRLIHIESLNSKLLGPTRVSRPLPHPIFISNLPTEMHARDLDLAKQSALSFNAMLSDSDDDADSLDGFDASILSALTEGTPLNKTLNVSRRTRLDMTKILSEIERPLKIENRIYQDPFYLHVLAATRDATIVVRDDFEFSEIERSEPTQFMYFPGPGIPYQKFDNREAFLRSVVADVTEDQMKTIRVWTLRSLARIGNHPDPSRLTRKDLISHLLRGNDETARNSHLLRGNDETARNRDPQSSGSFVASNRRNIEA